MRKAGRRRGILEQWEVTIMKATFEKRNDLDQRSLSSKPEGSYDKSPREDTSPEGTAVDKPRAASKPNALQQPLQPSADLAAVVGGGTMARGEMVSKVWVYIKANKLQNPDDGREILADDKLQKVFGKAKVTMFEMNKLLAQHLK